MPLTKEQIVNLRKIFSILFSIDLIQKKTTSINTLKRDFNSNVGLIQNQSYQDDLLSEIFPNKN
jgi:hypothetical protein